MLDEASLNPTGIVRVIWQCPCFLSRAKDNATKKNPKKLEECSETERDVLVQILYFFTFSPHVFFHIFPHVFFFPFSPQDESILKTIYAVTFLFG